MVKYPTRDYIVNFPYDRCKEGIYTKFTTNVISIISSKTYVYLYYGVRLGICSKILEEINFNIEEI